MNPRPGEPAQVYSVELLFESPPVLDPAGILAAVRTRLPDAVPLDPSGENNVLAIAHPGHPVTLDEGELHPLTYVCPSDEPFAVSERIERAMQHSWDFPDVRAVVDRCRASVLVTELMARTLPYAERLALFEDALAGILEVLPVRAVFWQPSRRVVDPGHFLAAHARGGAPRLLSAALNVRSYSIGDPPAETLMDTLGLAALGLPDVQCHFRGLDRPAVARLLFNTAHSLFEQGDVIGDGQTIEGLEPGSRWVCRRAESLNEPRRTVVDIDPGPPFAAGARGEPAGRP